MPISGTWSSAATKNALLALLHQAKSESDGMSTVHSAMAAFNLFIAFFSSWRIRSCGNSVFGGQLVQGGFIITEPSLLQDVTTAFVQPSQSRAEA